MNCKIQLNDEAADQIVICSLRNSIALLKKQNLQLRRNFQKKHYVEWSKAQLAENLVELDAMEKTYAYYGGK